MKRIIVAAFTASALTTSAFAADAIVYNEPAPAALPVTAPASDWTGPYVGVQLGYGFADIEGVEGDGILGGVHAGYNYDLGGFVVGGEVDYDFADIEFDGGLGEVDGVARGKLKAGVDLGRAMVYGTGGIAHATADTALGEFDDIGYVVGAGVDFAATDQIVVGTDYLYHSFDDFDDTGLDVDAHTVRARASYRF